MLTILASASPRRRELMEQLGVEFIVQPAKGEEVVTKTDPEEIVQELAYQKAAEIAGLILTEYHTGHFALSKKVYRVIGADTIVVHKGEIYGKPKDEADAYRMLKSLQGKTHQVYTGVCVIDLFSLVSSDSQERYLEDPKSAEPVIKVFAEKTDVTMYRMKKQEILDYIETKEPMDKAGAYAIQGISAKFIKKIKGDYYNVVGRPMARLYQEFYK